MLKDSVNNTLFWVCIVQKLDHYLHLNISLMGQVHALLLLLLQMNIMVPIINEGVLLKGLETA